MAKTKAKSITIIQMEAAKKKITTLRKQEQKLTKQITPLKILVRKFIQEHEESVTLASGINGKFYLLPWALDKIRRGYFGTDVNLSTLVQIMDELTAAGLLGKEK